MGYKAPLLYTVSFMADKIDPAVTTRYYIGNSPRPWATVSPECAISAPKTGRIISVSIRFFMEGGAGSNEDCDIAVSINGIDYGLVKIPLNVTIIDIQRNSLNIPILQGDVIEIVVSTPLWLLSPTGVYISGNILFESE